MKVTALLRNDHDTVTSLFEKYRKAGSRNQNGKKELFEMIRQELTAHFQLEEEIFYTALKETASRRAGELASSALEEHNSIEELLDELAGMSPQDPKFDFKMAHVIAEVERHIEREEEEIFEEARKTLPEFRIEELGLEMEDRRKLLEQIAA